MLHFLARMTMILTLILTYDLDTDLGNDLDNDLGNDLGNDLDPTSLCLDLVAVAGVPLHEHDDVVGGLQQRAVVRHPQHHAQLQLEHRGQYLS